MNEPGKPPWPLEKIVSGGQTGADRAALDWAIEHQIAHGGWCPKGRKAIDGVIPARYHLRETRSAAYPERTALNVRDSDGTVIFSIGPTLQGGSRLTVARARKHAKPYLHLSRRDGATASRQLLAFLREHHITILNVAGPRAEKEPEVGAFVREILEGAYQEGITEAMEH